MSFLINPFTQYEVAAPTMIGSVAARSVGNPGNPVSLSFTQTFNLFRVYVVHWEFINTVTLVSATLGGYNVPIVTQQNVIQGSSGCGVALLTFRWPLPSQTAAMVLTFSANPTAASIGTWNIFRNSSDTPYFVQTATKDTVASAINLQLPVLPRSLNIIACTNLIDGTVTFSNTAPPSIQLGYTQGSPATSPQFRMASSGINNGSSSVDYSGEIVTVTSSLASCAYALIGFI